MTREYNYEIGDYVKYNGDNSSSSKTLSNPDFGKIEKFENHHGVERIYMFLIGKKQHIWCDFQDIRQIFTDAVHLKLLNFKTIETNGIKKYKFNSITISGTIISVFNINYELKYCIGDISNGIPKLEKYLKGRELDLEKVFIDYPDVSNLNDLLNYLKKQGVEFDEKKIIKAY